MGALEAALRLASLAQELDLDFVEDIPTVIAQNDPLQNDLGSKRLATVSSEARLLKKMFLKLRD